MNQAHAQTAEVIGAASQASTSYMSQAGAAAGTAMIFVFVLLGIAFLLHRRLEARDREIGELKAAHEKAVGELKTAHERALGDLKAEYEREIAQAKLDAEAAVEKRFQTAWQRVAEIFGSVNILFGKVDASNLKLADTLKALELTLATKGIVAK